MDKALMLKQIKEHYGYRSDAQFAKFLGITPQSYSNWKSRNTFDAELIYTKCLELNPKWLLTGKGEMIKRKDREADPPELDDRDRYIVELQKEKIDRLEEELILVKKELQSCLAREKTAAKHR